jgi:TatD DNase family protein
MILDMHCHLDRYRDPAKVANEAARAGVAIVAVTNLPSHFQQGKGPVSALTNVRLSLGLHPLLAPHSSSEQALFAQLLSSTSYVGEIGLDFSKEGISKKKDQIESFELVLTLIQGLGKIVSIHSRGAEEAVLQHLMFHQIDTAIFHWFSGSEKELLRIVEAGYYLSVNGAMLSSKRMRPLLARLSKTCLLLETDGPYTKTGNAPTRPAHLRRLIPELALLWDATPNDVESQLVSNFQALMSRLDKKSLGKTGPR